MKITLNFLIITIIALIVIVGTPSVFGESPVLIQTDKKEYSIGEDIILQGTVKFVNGKAVGIGLPKNLDVAIEVYNSKNRLVTAYVTDVKNDDTFSLKIETGEDSPILTDGRYFFVAYYGIAAQQLLNTDFVGRYDVHVGANISNPSPTASPMPDNTRSNPTIHIPARSQLPELQQWMLIGILAIAISLAIIIKKILESRPKIPEDLERTLKYNFKNKTGDEFEELVADLYRKKGYTVKKTAKGPDKGVDLILKKWRWLGRKRIIVQAKNWRDPVGSPVIRDAAGARQQEQYKNFDALVITSSYFTSQARKALKDISDIKGIDGEELKREFRRYFKI